MRIEILDVFDVEKYYRVFKEDTWTIVHRGKAKIRTNEGKEMDVPMDILVNKYGDVLIRDGLCVNRYSLRDVRGWEMVWEDESPFVVCLVEDYVEKFWERFEPVLAFPRKKVLEVLYRAEKKGVNIDKLFGWE